MHPDNYDIDTTKHQHRALIDILHHKGIDEWSDAPADNLIRMLKPVVDSAVTYAEAYSACRAFLTLYPTEESVYDKCIWEDLQADIEKDIKNATSFATLIATVTATVQEWRSSQGETYADPENGPDIAWFK